jgi:hypothetical protein
MVMCAISGKNASNASPKVSSSCCGGALVVFFDWKFSNGAVMVFISKSRYEPHNPSNAM